MGQFRFEVICEESHQKLLVNRYDCGSDRRTRSMDEVAGADQYTGRSELAA
jgi:hypothetical protein